MGVGPYIGTYPLGVSPDLLGIGPYVLEVAPNISLYPLVVGPYIGPYPGGRTLGPYTLDAKRNGQEWEIDQLLQFCMHNFIFLIFA